MCVIYMTSPGFTARKRDGRVCIADQDGNIHYKVPLQDIESVVVCSNAQLTTGLIYALLERKAKISYLDYRGEVVGTLGDEQCSLERLLMQQKCFADEGCQRQLIRLVLSRKLQNQQAILRLYGKRKQSAALKGIAEEIDIYKDKLQQKCMVDELRGLEGMASRRYFDGFPQILDQELWNWQGRNRRPPKDPVNSLLSYGYAFLEREVRSAIAGARLDCRIGFLHSNDCRKDSLVFDLMELFRQSVVDHFVLRLLNYKTFAPIDFHYEENGACMMSEAVRKKWFMRYEEYMSEKLKSLEGKCWRSYIRDEVNDFAEKVWQFRLLAS